MKAEARLCPQWLCLGLCCSRAGSLPGNGRGLGPGLVLPRLPPTHTSQKQARVWPVPCVPLLIPGVKKNRRPGKRGMGEGVDVEEGLKGIHGDGKEKIKL